MVKRYRSKELCFLSNARGAHLTTISAPLAASSLGLGINNSGTPLLLCMPEQNGTAALSLSGAALQECAETPSKHPSYCAAGALGLSSSQA